MRYQTYKIVEFALQFIFVAWVSLVMEYSALSEATL
jgi:hypothetical protein